MSDKKEDKKMIKSLVNVKDLSTGIHPKKRKDTESADLEPDEKRQRIEEKTESETPIASPSVPEDEVYGEPPPSPIPVFQINRSSYPLQIKSAVPLKGRGVNANLATAGKIIPAFLNDFVQDIIWLLKCGDKTSPISNSCLAQGYLGGLRRCHIAVCHGTVPSPQGFVNISPTLKGFLGQPFWQPLVFYNPGKHLRTEISAIMVMIANSGMINTVSPGKESWELGFKKLNLVPVQMSYLFPVDNSTTVEDSSEEKCKRTKFLMSITEMANSKLPLPIEPKSHYSCPTKPLYMPVSGISPLVGIDVENTAEPIRFTAIKETKNEMEDKVLYDCLIQDVANTRTREDCIQRFPDILSDPKAAKLLDQVKGSLAEARAEFSKCLPQNAILISHQAINELRSMELSHPYLVDSSLIYTIDDKSIPGLKELTLEHLGREIQKNPMKHDPAEDAEASLNLVQFKMKKSFQYKNERYIRTIKEENPPLSAAKGKVSIISSSEEIDFWKKEVDKHVLEAGGVQTAAHNNISYYLTNSNGESILKIESISLSNQLMVSVHNIVNLEKLEAVKEIADIAEKLFLVFQKNTLFVLLLINSESVSLSLMTIKK